MIEFYFQTETISFFCRNFFDQIFWAKIFRQIFFGNFFQQTLASRNFQPAKFSAIKIFSPKKFRKKFLALAIRVDRFRVGRASIDRSQRRRRTLPSSALSSCVRTHITRATHTRTQRIFRSKPPHGGTPSPPLFDPFY